MKKTARFVALLLAIVMITGCSGKNAGNDYDYTIEDNKVIITGYKGKDKEIVIPSEIDKMPVTEIGDNAFEKTEITAVEIPDSVTLVHPYAFANCLSLKKAVVGAGVEEISEGMFAYDTALEDITFKGDIRTVEANAFADTAFSKSEEFVTVGDGILVAYNGTSGNVVVPEKVKDIGTVFSSNTLIKNVYLPDTVTELANSAFSGCAQLSEITLPSTLTLIGTSAFASCYVLMSVEIPASVREISDLAFFNCVSLHKITIPGTVETLGDEIFRGCGNVTVTTPFDSAAFGYATANNIPIAQ